jgi:malonate transporter and related proteins
MTLICNALLPVLGMILCGFLLRRAEFLPEQFWPGAEKLTYYLLMPAMLITNLASKKMDGLPWLKLLFTVEGTVLASALLVTVWWLAIRRMDGPMFTSFFQGGVRFNTFAALALSEGLFGKDGLLIAAMGAGFMILFVNILTVAAFSLATGNGGIQFRKVMTDLAKNPLIIACVVGVGLNAAGLKLPSALDNTMVLAGKAAFPIGLMAVGAAFRAEHIGDCWHPLIVSAVVQFLCKPLLAWNIASYCGLSGLALSVAVLLFSVPTAPAAYILSRQMGGNHDAMASILPVGVHAAVDHLVRKLTPAKEGL